MPQELLQDLVMLQSKGAALEARVSSALEQTIMNEEDYETLQTEVNVNRKTFIEWMISDVI